MQELKFDQVEAVSGGDFVEGASAASSGIVGAAAGAAVFGGMKFLGKVGMIAAVGNPVGIALIASGAVLGAGYYLLKD